LIVQLAFTARVPPQVVLVIVNWFGFVPAIEMLLIVSTAVPGLDRANANGALVVPLARVPKAWEAGVRFAAG
jgi:hypothetical protein